MSQITFIHKASLDRSNELKTSKKTLILRAQREERRVSKEAKLQIR